MVEDTRWRDELYIPFEVDPLSPLACPYVQETKARQMEVLEGCQDRDSLDQRRAAMKY